jgi:hypothetical protein
MSVYVDIGLRMLNATIQYACKGATQSLYILLFSELDEVLDKSFIGILSVFTNYIHLSSFERIINLKVIFVLLV